MRSRGIVNACVAVLALQSVVPACASEAPPDIATVCANTACRTGGYDAVVGVDAEHYTTIPVTHSPYLLDDGSVLIFPGETIAVQFAVDGDKIGKPLSAKRYAPHLPLQVVISGGAPTSNPENDGLPIVTAKMPADEVALLGPNTLLLSYGQLKERGSTGMALIIEHNLAHTMKLDAIVAELAVGKYKQHYTSTCPIMPKMWGYESWPNALGPLVLGNFRFLPDGGTSLTCN